ncbi:hypothetical protein FB461_2189 [Rarobacter faecitabidus]|uniref:Uncharacterized protein n=1 Tax=Rarobacter faecitabidus TaxID=13243 RepID=A0A542ZAU6_RARFA|nr:hypothetical protein FB461_2189 [Rarobacter faecitabidus]
MCLPVIDRSSHAAGMAAGGRWWLRRLEMRLAAGGGLWWLAAWMASGWLVVWVTEGGLTAGGTGGGWLWR